MSYRRAAAGIRDLWKNPVPQQRSIQQFKNLDQATGNEKINYGTSSIGMEIAYGERF